MNTKLPEGNTRKLLSTQAIARIIASLFITTMLAGIVDSYLCLPLLHSHPNIIIDNTKTVYAGIFLNLYMAVGVVGIALFLFPVLKAHSEIVAQTYLVFRTIECVCYIIGIIATFFILNFNVELNRNIGGLLPSGFEAGQATALSLRAESFQMAMIILAFNSIFMCILLYKTRLVPRLIAGLGFIGYVLLFLSGVLDLLGILNSTGSGSLLYIPGGIFELIVFPAWLVIKGFNTTTK